MVLFVLKEVCPFRLFVAIAGLAEGNSEHPLGQAVVKFATSVSLCDLYAGFVFNLATHGVSPMWFACLLIHSIIIVETVLRSTS